MRDLDQGDQGGDAVTMRAALLRSGQCLLRVPTRRSCLKSKAWLSPRHSEWMEAGSDDLQSDSDCFEPFCI